MSINRMPLFCWTILATSFAVIFAYPTLNVANILLELDRKFGMHFYDPAAGGHVLLWQHLFWFFGHPDVYIIFLPAAGMVSEIISTFSRRPVVAYTGLALAAVATAIISFGVWAHHMFAVGLPAFRPASSAPLPWSSPFPPASRSLPGSARSGMAGRSGRRPSSLSSALSSSLSSAGSAASCSPSYPLTSRSPTATSWWRTFTTS